MTSIDQFLDSRSQRAIRQCQLRGGRGWEAATPRRLAVARQRWQRHHGQLELLFKRRSVFNHRGAKRAWTLNRITKQRRSANSSRNCITKWSKRKKQADMTQSSLKVSLQTRPERASRHRTPEPDQPRAGSLLQLSPFTFQLHMLEYKAQERRRQRLDQSRELALVQSSLDRQDLKDQHGKARGFQ